jgi:amino-acid N-acetyltransferase
VTVERARPLAVAIRAATGADLRPVLALLEAAKLPLAGVPQALTDFFVAENQGRVVGAIGLELYGSAALLRSAVVHPDARGTGIGAALVDTVLGLAQARRADAVYLLTSTADRYFPRFGFERITRADVPEAVKLSVEFREACPASAVAMRKMLRPN